LRCSGVLKPLTLAAPRRTPTVQYQVVLWIEGPSPNTLPIRFLSRP
jgi:hypothetical protein